MMLMLDVPRGLGGLVREHTMPASAAAHQPAHSLPSLPASRCTSVLRARCFSPECSKLLSLSHPAWHHYTSDFIWTHKWWQMVVKLQGHQKQWVNSSWIRVPLPTDTFPGSSKGLIPLAWWRCPGRARWTLRISVHSLGLILTCIVFLLKMFFINKKASSFYTYFSVASLTQSNTVCIAKHYFVL